MSSRATTDRDRSVSLNKIGGVRRAKGDLTGALEAYDEGLDIARRLAEDQTNADAQRDLSVSLGRTALVRAAQYETAEALLRYREALKIAERLAAKAPDIVVYGSDIAYFKARIAELED